METKELNFESLAEYIKDTYGDNGRILTKLLRNFAIDYGRVNMVLGTLGESYISLDSYEHLEMIKGIADALDRPIE